MTAPVPAGPTDAHAELRFRLTDLLWSHQVWAFNGTQIGCSCDHQFRTQPEHRAHLADAVLALDAVRDALAAQEKLRRVEKLAESFDTLGRSLHSVPAADAYDDAAVLIRRALDGEPS